MTEFLRHGEITPGQRAERRAELVALLDELNTRIAALDAELLRLAGPTPGDRRAFMRRMTRRINRAAR